MKNHKITFYLILVSVLLFYVGFIVSRLIPFDFDHIVYMCQSALQSLPNTFNYLVWGITTVITMKIIADYISIQKQIKKYTSMPTPRNLNELLIKHNILDKVIIYQNSEPEAYCIGLLKPKIYISSQLIKIMDENEFESILIHEMYHMQNRNNLILYILNYFSYILFPFPFIKDLSKHYELQAEIEADKMASISLNKHNPLLKALKKLLLYKPSSINYGFGFSKAEAVEYRIKSLVSGKAQSTNFSLRRISISIISFIIFSLLLFLPISRTHIHAEGKDYLVVCYDNSDCQNICRSNVQIKPLYTPITNASIR